MSLPIVKATSLHSLQPFLRYAGRSTNTNTVGSTVQQAFSLQHPADPSPSFPPQPHAMGLQMRAEVWSGQFRANIDVRGMGMGGWQVATLAIIFLSFANLFMYEKMKQVEDAANAAKEEAAILATMLKTKHEENTRLKDEIAKQNTCVLQ